MPAKPTRVSCKRCITETIVDGVLPQQAPEARQAAHDRGVRLWGDGRVQALARFEGIMKAGEAVASELVRANGHDVNPYVVLSGFVAASLRELCLEAARLQVQLDTLLDAEVILCDR